jgi:hypothetical protein
MFSLSSGCKYFISCRSIAFALWLTSAPETYSITWTSLAIELIFEYIIRPSHYHELMQSDKAFAPATARHLNWFHFFCELLALILFLPLMPCVFDRARCEQRTPLSPINTALLSVASSDNVKAAGARFLSGKFTRC